MNSLPREPAGTAGAASSTLRHIGSALGPAVFGAVPTAHTVVALPDHASAEPASTRPNAEGGGVRSRDDACSRDEAFAAPVAGCQAAA
ncbi:hypothetical protein [Streptomyces sp. NPDC005017]|uniref:hypothetical protein n=1 Tax=Streptomyces sp. NPDC005017 TaxID=3364706 RepID=UPI0036C2B7A0